MKRLAIDIITGLVVGCFMVLLLWAKANNGAPFYIGSAIFIALLVWALYTIVKDIRF